MAGFEPALSCSQGRRISRLSYIPNRDSTRSSKQPVRESNPPLRLERAVSCAYRRTGRLNRRLVSFVAHDSEVGRVALESTSPPFQSGARPSQLPARVRNAIRGRATL